MSQLLRNSRSPNNKLCVRARMYVPYSFKNFDAIGKNWSIIMKLHMDIMPRKTFPSQYLSLLLKILI